MAKITFPTLTAQFASQAWINARFDELAAEFQDNVLYRTNPASEPNTMSQELDMNSNDIINIGTLRATNLVLDDGDITDLVGRAETAAVNAEASETAASGSATAASNSATAADASETAALASENKAEQWAEEDEDTPVETGPDKFSAKHWAAKAAGAVTGVTSFNGRIGVVVPAISDYDADQIDYDNVTSGLAATEVQEAIDELAALPAPPVDSVFGRIGAITAASSDYDADQVDYDNTTSGLAAVEVQAAIDEIAAGAGTANTDLSNLSAAGFDKIFDAWVSFNGVGTPVIRGSANVTSVTGIASGQYRMNYTINQATADYAVFGMANQQSVRLRNSVAVDVAYVEVSVKDDTGANQDSDYVFIGVIGGQ